MARKQNFGFGGNKAFSLFRPKCRGVAVACDPGEISSGYLTLRPVLRENNDVQPNQVVSPASLTGVTKADSPAENEHVPRNKDTIKRNKLDEFDLRTVIGKGNYGKVILVKSNKESDKGTFYAMKVVSKIRLAGTGGFKSILNERSVMMELDFPYIAKLIMSFQTEQKLFMVLELCSGGTLRFHMTNSRIFHDDMRNVVFYVAEIALTLKYLNDKRIIFRDLKVENILLDGDGHAKLSDFGMVKPDVPSWTTGATTVCGTPNTMAPEVFVHTYYGYSCDYWSLGVIAYEMFSRRFPFYGRTRDDLITKIINDKVRVLRSWPDCFKQFLSAILMKHPDTRLGAEGGGDEVLRHALFADSPYAIDVEKLSKRLLPAPIKPVSFDPNLSSETGLNPRVTVCSEAGEAAFNAESNTYEVGSSVLPRDSNPGELLSTCLNVDEKELVKSLGGERDKLTNFDSIRKSDIPVPDYKRTKIKNVTISADDLSTMEVPPLSPPMPLKVEGFTYDGIVEHSSGSMKDGVCDEGEPDTFNKTVFSS